MTLALLLLGAGSTLQSGTRQYDLRREGDLNVGDLAPDVPLVALDGKKEVRLRDYVGGKPLVLIFGSYT